MLGVLLGCLTLFFLWWKLNNWGAWKLHRTSPDGVRIKYDKKWYGWVDEQTARAREEKWKALKEWISKTFTWKTTTMDFGWMFWDPDGSLRRRYQECRDKTLLRYLPKWMRTDQSTISQHAPQRASDSSEAERGLLRRLTQPIKTRPIDISFSRTSRNFLRALRKPEKAVIAKELGPSIRRRSTVEESPVDGESSTVRRRSAAPGAKAVWQNGSDEVNRAVHHQMLLPNIDTLPEQDLFPEHPSQEAMFPFSPTEDAIVAKRQDQMPVPDDVGSNYATPQPHEREFDAVAYEMGHASDKSLFSNKSVSSRPQKENASFKPPPNVPRDICSGGHSSSEAVEFYTPPTHPSDVPHHPSPMSTRRTPTHTTKRSISINADHVDSVMLANIENASKPKLSSLGLGIFPMQPTRIHAVNLGRSQSLTTPTKELHPAEVKKQTLDDMLGSRAMRFPRLTPRQYMHNTRPRGPSLLSRAAHQIPSSPSTVTSEGDDTSQPPRDANPIPAENDSVGADVDQDPFEGFSQAGSDRPEDERRSSLNVERVREPSDHDPSWSNATRPKLLHVDWQGFS